MNLKRLLELLAIVQCISLSQHSRVHDAKQRVRHEVRDALGIEQRHHARHQPMRIYRMHRHRNQWSGRQRSIERHHLYTAWTAWSACSGDCIRRRERHCRQRRKCGLTRHIEERKCWSCAPSTQPPLPAPQQTIVINAASTSATSGPPTPPHVKVPVIEEIAEQQQPPMEDVEEVDGDFFAFRRAAPRHRARPPMLLDADAFAELTADEDYDELLQAAHKQAPPKSQQRQMRQMGSDYGGIEGDTFQYEDFDFEQELPRAYNPFASQGLGTESQYGDSYEDADYGEGMRNGSLLAPPKERATPDGLSARHRRLYSKWSRWTKCSPKCTTRRYKKCRVREQCGREVLREIAYCYTEGSFCQQWLQAQMQKTPSSAYELRPVAMSRRRDVTDASGGGGGGGSASGSGGQSNAIVSDFIMNGKGYRGPEYMPQKLRCGIAAIRSNKRNMYNMLKIIGGKAARKGEWPWQVAIFNRFKEAFCGGTLIAPQWVLTAAHCVRKVLYVRIGEHNLDYEDGTELHLRVLKSYKHPNFDKKTVDSDIALLKLPKPVNASTWIGYSCLPRPYQPLPKNLDCTVIGWGKRRNRDVAGTSVLHQAEVPIIPMDNCRSVYHDYTITKNMFCAGHKRGRIDTCAGDSGGPLLCRDTTKPNHPWTIFGITSFGDGCAKRNKFGIYAKVPNYVDWVWSVINCNGNCKLQHRSNGT